MQYYTNYKNLRYGRWYVDFLFKNTLIFMNVLHIMILIENYDLMFYELMLKKSKSIEFYVENLDYWTKEGSFITMLSVIDKKADFNIIYKSAGNFERSKKRLKANIPGLSKSKIIERDHKDWLRICFDNKSELN